MANDRTVAVIGQGYVGLPLAIAAASHGWSVIGIDLSVDLVSQLNAGQSHIEDVSSTVLQSHLDAKLYRASNNGDDVASVAICVICVPTPLDSNRKPDLTFLESASKLIAPFVKSNALIISESTSFPGTVRDFVKPIFEKARSDHAVELDFASAPERVDPRNVHWEMSNTPRLVAGLTPRATKRALDFYNSFCDQVIEVSSPEVAESAKLLENTFRQVNIALVNQLVPFCNAIGIDIREVIEAAGTKPYGFMKFFPGAGVGGHCIPIDPLYLLERARQFKVDLPFIESADIMNRQMPHYVAQRLIDLAKPVHGSTLAIIGVAYKSGISDVRESPAMDVANYLQSQGYRVVWHDPLVKKFENWEPLRMGETVAGAIIVTAQPSVDVLSITQGVIPTLDCTGKFKGIAGVVQL